VGDVYACPFAIHDAFLAGNVLEPGGFTGVWRDSELFRRLREPQGGACTSCSAYDSCRGGCMAAKFFTGLPLDGPDPECVQGHGEQALSRVDAGSAPRPGQDHSHAAGRRSSGPVPVRLGSRPQGWSPAAPGTAVRACDPDPLAGLHAAAAVASRA
jgi:radical SAM protein with 4Fe4S-binding SPASM domain